MNFWQKCLHRSLSYSIQHQLRGKDWEVNIPASIFINLLVMSINYSSVVTIQKDKKIEELEVGAGGRVKELEDLTVGEFRKPGQSYMDAKLETQLRYHQEYKDKLPTDGVCRVIYSDSVASPTLSSCSLKERNLPPRVRVKTLITIP